MYYGSSASALQSQHMTPRPISVRTGRPHFHSPLPTRGESDIYAISANYVGHLNKGYQEPGQDTRESMLVVGTTASAQSPRRHALGSQEGRRLC